LEAGMMREWNEEIDFKGNILEKKLVGILNDESRPVEAVHLGLVYSFVGDSPEISIKETEKMEGRLVNLKEISKYIEGNPSVWTQIFYKEYLSKL
jgi:predicted NUDIX family phosphoesterase